MDLAVLIDEADKYAKENSVEGIIGRVTRFESVKIGETHYVSIDISFEDYLKTQVRRGEYLAIRSIIPKVTIVGIIDTITRSDMLATLKIRETTNNRDPSTIMTPTTIQLSPIAEIDDKEKVRPAVSPIDPQSPVFRPKAELLEKALGIPMRGVVIGNIYSGGEEIDAEVRLDEDTLRHHSLLIGTTGAGKTTTLKEIVNDESIEKQNVIFDRQGDFVRFSISKLDDTTIIMPVTKLMEGKEIQDYVIKFIDRYSNCKDVEYADDSVVLDCGNKIRLVPYSINFGDIINRFHKLTPYMSLRASMAWESLIRITKNKIIKGISEYFSLPNKDSYIIFITEILPRISIENLYSGYIEFESKKLPTNKSKKTQLISTNGDKIIISTKDAFFDSEKELKLPSQTTDAIERTLKAYGEYGIFNVEGSYQKLSEKILQSRNLIIDLSWVLDYTASIEALSTITYKILSDFFDLKDKKYKEGKNDILSLLIMDEAHEYFPQGGEEVSKEIIEEFLNKLMRLGRVRNIGVIMATHVPDDLNPLILQLSNTKIIMRNELEIIRKMYADEFADLLINAQPGVGLIRSIKFSNVVFRSKMI